MSVVERESDDTLSLLRYLIGECYTGIEEGDFKRSNESIFELAEFLNSLAENTVSDPDNETLVDNVFAVLSEIQLYIVSPSHDQAVVDALSFELPKVVARFACVSQRCVEIAESIIDRLIEICSPRDMLSIFCEALDSPSMMFKVPGYYAPLLGGVAKVLVLIQRRQFEQLKEAIPVIVNVLKTVMSEPEEEKTNYEDLLMRSVDVAGSIHLLFTKLEGNVKEKVRALLGLYVLQIMTFVSFGTNLKAPNELSLVQQLSRFLQYSDMSYTGLITGSDVDSISATLGGEFGDDGMRCFSYTKHGACLAVIWGYKSNEIAETCGEDVVAVIAELSKNQAKRWQALGMLRYMLICSNLSWELKKQAIDFLLRIIDGKISSTCNSDLVECSSVMTTLFSALQAVEMVIMYAPDPMIKKNAFDAFKKVLTDIPASSRFDTLMALINNSDSSSMIAILIDCVRNEMRMENCQITKGDQVTHVENYANQNTSFWNAGILELVALVLRPPKGGPPSLPEFADAVLAALNLYRFVLMTESIGNSNRTGVLSMTNLQKAYNEWLLPLRILVTGIMAENRKDSAEIALDIVCGLNPVEFVLYHCIELVEEKLQKVHK